MNSSTELFKKVSRTLKKEKKVSKISFSKVNLKKKKKKKQVSSHWGSLPFQNGFKFTQGYFSFIYVLAKFMSCRSFPENKTLMLSLPTLE